MHHTIQALSDDNKRAIYDRYGEAGLKGGMGGMGGSGGMGSDFSNPFDIFESFFGGGMGGLGGMGGMGGRTRSRATTGEDDRCVRRHTMMPICSHCVPRATLCACLLCACACACACVHCVCVCLVHTCLLACICIVGPVYAFACSDATFWTRDACKLEAWAILSAFISHSFALLLLVCRRYDLQLDFLEAVFGCAREIDVDRLASCSVSVQCAN